MRSIAVALVLLPAAAAADSPKLTLDQVIEKAIANPKVRMAQADIAAAEARSAEARAAAYPRIKTTAFGTISPEINCVDPACTITDPQNFAWRFSGLFGSAQLEITQPLYTFGKIAHARRAAVAGVDAQQALAAETAGDVAVDAATAYWGLKLARELGYMLEDGIDEITDAQKHFNERKDVTMQDRQRVAVLLAEAKAQLADARQGQLQALAGLRAVTGIADADIDDAELAPVTHTIPDAPQLADAAKRRPQAVAALAGAVAASELEKMQFAQFFPDFAVVATGVVARAQGADDPPSAFANDPYNRTGAGVVLALQWQVDPWTLRAKLARTRAEASKAKEQAELAALGASYDAATAAAEAITAKEKLDAVTEGERAGRAWVAAVLQNEAVGTAEANDLADAYIAWFRVRADLLRAIYQWNLAVVRLGRATGEFKPGAQRQR